MTPHLIITRFMIGVARPTAFLRHAHLMLETLHPGLAGQTSDNFHWAVVTDGMIDPESEALILRQFAAHPNFHLEKINPFSDGGAKLPISELCEKYFGTTKDVITTRIDDDDGLRVTFVADVQRHIADGRSSGNGLVSCSFVKGMRLAAHLARYDLYSARAGASAGMSVFSANVRKVNVHSFNHNKVHTRVAQKGGIALHVDTPEPYYLVGVHPGSASREKRSQKEAIRRIKKNFKKCSRRDSTYTALISSFGLPTDFAERIAKVDKEFIDPRPAMLDPLPGQDDLFMTRMSTKSAYLRMAERLRERAEAAGLEGEEELRLELHLLRQAYYSL